MFAVGCSAGADDDASSSSEAAITEGLHEPQGAERTAILHAFREVLEPELAGQDFEFNSTAPPGRFQAHGDWASYEGVLQGPDANATPIDYTRTQYKDRFQGGYLAGVTVNGNFAATFFAMAHREGDGTWHVLTIDAGARAYAVGPLGDMWRAWASEPPVAFRDVSREYPKDDLHEPQGAERTAILTALHAVIDPELNGQECAFNSTNPPGVFQAHDGWAYYQGIIEGPDGNATPIDYTKTIYRWQSGQPGFQGVLRNGNFAARLTALLERQPDGSWKVSAQDLPNGQHSAGYSVGTFAPYLGDVGSFSWDIFGVGK